MRADSDSVSENDQWLYDDEDKMLFDFTSECDFNEESAKKWYESIDVGRNVGGVSKATLVLQKTEEHQRAVLFALINTKNVENEEEFVSAGVQHNITFDYNILNEWDQKKVLELLLRSQGSLEHWKIVLKERPTEKGEKHYTYEATFSVDSFVDHENFFENVIIQYDDFKAHYNGQEVFDAPKMELTKIETFGIEAIGGHIKQDGSRQAGVGSLEIKKIHIYDYFGCDGWGA